MAEVAMRLSNLDALIAAAKDCADDLEAEIEQRYAGMKDYPCVKRKYDLDMGTVVRLRQEIEIFKLREAGKL